MKNKKCKDCDHWAYGWVHDDYVPKDYFYLADSEGNVPGCLDCDPVHAVFSYRTGEEAACDNFARRQS